MSIQGAIDSTVNSVANAVLGSKAIDKLENVKPSEPVQEQKEPVQEELQNKQETIQTAIEQKPDWMRILDYATNRSENSLKARIYTANTLKARQRNTLEFIRSKRMEGETV